MSFISLSWLYLYHTVSGTTKALHGIIPSMRIENESVTVIDWLPFFSRSALMKLCLVDG